MRRLSPDPRRLSRTTAVAGRRSAKPIGLKLIQKIASSGNTTTRATEISVGANMPHAKRASRRASGVVPLGGVDVVIYALAGESLHIPPPSADPVHGNPGAYVETEICSGPGDVRGHAGGRRSVDRAQRFVHGSNRTGSIHFAVNILTHDTVDRL